jgi:hypothetical protein
MVLLAVTHIPKYKQTRLEKDRYYHQGTDHVVVFVAMKICISDNNNNKVTLRSCVHSVLADKNRADLKIKICKYRGNPKFNCFENNGTTAS